MKIKSSALLKLCLLSSILLISACGESESEIAKKIKLRVSTGGTVLPNGLIGTDSAENSSTCSNEDISPPRVRLSASIAWEGGVEYGVLVPYVMQLDIKDANVGEYTGVVAPSSTFESISFYFGATTDFIPNTGAVFSSSRCFADYGGLPAPANELTGQRQLRVKAKVIMSGVTRTTADNTEKGPNIEQPFVKEVETEILYTAGSIPAS